MNMSESDSSKGYKIKFKPKKTSKRKKPIIRGRVKELRKLEKKTQALFAESIDVSSNTISRIEREEISLTSDIALAIADAYGISLDWLFYRSEEMMSPKNLENASEAFECMNQLSNGE